MAAGLLFLVIAIFVLIRTVRGRPRLANVLLHGVQGAQKVEASG